jgi:hypothetical protein
MCCVNKHMGIEPRNYPELRVNTEGTPATLDYGRSPHAYVNQMLQIQLEFLIMSGMPLETC